MKGASTSTFTVKLTVLTITALLGLFSAVYIATPSPQQTPHDAPPALPQTRFSERDAVVKAPQQVQAAAPIPTADDDDEADAEAASCDRSRQAALSCTAKEWHDDAIAVANAAYQAAITANQPIDQAKAARDKAIAIAEACLTQNELSIVGTAQHMVTGAKARISCTPPKALQDAMSPYAAARDAEANARAARQEARQQQSQAATPAPVAAPATPPVSVEDPSHSHGLRHKLAMSIDSSKPENDWVELGMGDYGVSTVFVRITHGFHIPFVGAGNVQVWSKYVTPFTLHGDDGESQPISNAYLDYSMVCPNGAYPNGLMGATRSTLTGRDGHIVSRQDLSNAVISDKARAFFSDLFYAVCP